MGITTTDTLPGTKITYEHDNEYLLKKILQLENRIAMLELKVSQMKNIPEIHMPNTLTDEERNLVRMWDERKDSLPIL